MPNNALVKIGPMAAVGSIRSIWQGYQNARWGWHVVVPVGLGGAAAYSLSWAWTMLDQDEYGAAMLLTLFFLIVGIGTSLALPKRIVRISGIVAVVIITVFSGQRS